MPAETTTAEELRGPQRWRAMGMWEDGRSFLIVMGYSEADCRGRLDPALVDYDYADFQRIQYLWYEVWGKDELSEEEEWIPVKEIKLRRFRLLRAGQPAPVPDAPPLMLAG